MLKTSKKILSVLMVILLVLTAVPLSSFVGIELPAFDLGIRASAKTVASSGYCGPNVTYTYNSSTKELVISGEGPMTDYDYNDSPFYNSDIKSVVIGDGVTTIGNYAFYNCTNLSSITIPDSVTTIGSDAFYNCYNLTNITIPDSVTTISNSAFYNCSNLSSILIPDSVTTIGSSAFYNTAYYNNSSNWENNVLYIDNYLIKAKTSLSGSYTIKDGTKVIANNAFSGCTNLTSITIPDSVTTIGNYAFSGCTNLASAAIGAGVTLMGSSVFNGCPNLTELMIRTKEIPAYAFQNLTALKTVNLSEGVEKIGNYAFSGCTYLETINIPDSVTFVGIEILKNTAWFNYRGKGLIVLDGWAYGYKGSDENVTVVFDETVKAIAKDTFKSQSNIVAFEVNENNLVYSSENGILFNKDKTELIAYPCGKTDSEYVIPDTVEIIHNRAFYNNDNLSKVTLGNSATTIDDYAFYDCGNLRDITIGNGVTNIGDYAFYNCNSLRNLVIPDSVTTIGQEAFYNCSYLTSITIGKGIKSIGTEAFYLSSSRSRSVYITDLEAWCKIDFANYSANPMYTYSSSYSSSLYINGVAQSNITISATITEIKPYAFYYCDSIKTLTIPDSVTTIGKSAFYSCNNLTSVTLGDSVTTIGEYAFGYCDNLTTVTIPDSVTTIGDYAFRYCNNLTSVTIPDSVTTIGNGAFRYCNNLISITLSKDLQTIGESAFDGCSKLRDVFYPGSQEDWDKVYIDYNNSNLTNADLFLMHKHNYTVTLTKEPTCTQAGEALYTCVHRDTKTEVIQPLGHTWDEGKITANSTCSKGGTKTYTCTVCFATKSETIETLDHNYQLISSYNPTCTKDGYDVYRCTYCGTTENRTTEPLLGHNFESEFTVDIDSTCTVTGIKSKHCTRCTETAEETVIPLKNHAWQAEPTVTKIPTCTAEGESVVLCRDCKIVKDGSSAVIPALGHDAKNQPFTVDVPATCVSFGKQSRHCTRCNYIEQITRIPMSEHDYYVAEESTATCSKPGIAIYVCRMCKDSYTVENSPALGHDFEYIIIVSPTCKAEGYEMGDCSRCDATDTRPVATIDHDYVRTEVAPTCLEDGVATYTCSYGCGTSYDETLPALGHSYPANWVTILPATCTERGSAIKICRACSEVMSQVMPKLSHTDSNSDGVCDECGFGGESKPDTPPQPEVHEHSYKTTITLEATCDVAGVMKLTCSCGDVKMEAIPKLAHSDADGNGLCDVCGFGEEIKPDVPEDPSANCSCNCHKGGIMGILFKLVLLFQRFLHLNQTCSCGADHY